MGNIINFINSVNGKIITGFAFTIFIIVTLIITSNIALHTLVVWLHVVAGVIWIGLLYYFNFIQTPAMVVAMADEDGPGPAAIGKYIAPPALFWFRMAAAATWVLGLLALITLGGFKAIHLAFTFGAGFGLIGIGVWMGTIMVFNVWCIIWPNQRKILGLNEQKSTAEEIAQAKKNAALASSINVILSIPMLLAMLAHRF